MLLALQMVACSFEENFPITTTKSQTCAEEVARTVRVGFAPDCGPRIVKSQYPALFWRKTQRDGWDQFAQKRRSAEVDT